MLNNDKQNDFITMAEATKLLPGRPSIVSLWRWRTKGIAGVRLRYVTVGKLPLTTRKWLREFIIKSSEWKQDAQEHGDYEAQAVETDAYADAVA